MCKNRFYRNLYFGNVYFCLRLLVNGLFDLVVYLLKFFLLFWVCVISIKGVYNY